MAIRPPKTAKQIESRKAPNKPTLGSTPAIPEKAMASGIIAKATTSPERISREGARILSLTATLLKLKLSTYSILPYRIVIFCLKEKFLILQINNIDKWKETFLKNSEEKCRRINCIRIK